MSVSAAGSTQLQKEGVNKKVPYDEVMHKFKAGKLKSGGDGSKVTNPSQALAIMLSEKRQAEGGKKEYQSRKKSIGHRLVKGNK